MKRAILHLALVLGLISGSVEIFATTHIWSGSGPWTNGAPSGTTYSSDIFEVVSGTCTYTGTATIGTLQIDAGATFRNNGTLNTTNITITGNLKCTGTPGILNFNGGTFTLTNNITATTLTLNINSGNVTFASPYIISLSTLYINGTLINNATCIVGNLTIFSSGDIGSGGGEFDISGTFLIYNTFDPTNTYVLASTSTLDIRRLSNINLTDITGGTGGAGTSITKLNINSGTFTIDDVLTISNQINLQGGSLTINNPTNTNDVIATGLNSIVGSDVLTVSDASATSFNLTSGTTTISSTIDASAGGITVNGSSSIYKLNNSTTSAGTLTLSSGGTFQSVNSADVANIGDITFTMGHLLLNPNTTFNYTGSLPLTISGSNSSIAYLNANWPVTISGASDTIRNSIISELDVLGTSSSAVVNNSGGYTIGNITSFGRPVTINSLPHVDSLLVASSGGSFIINSSVRVKKLVNLVLGGSLASGTANLTMLEGSNLWFTTDGQITGTVNIHRKYGSIGWDLFGSPFDNVQDRTGVLYSGGTQTDYFNYYNESASYSGSDRWVGLSTGTNFKRGTGYQVGVGGTIVNDTLIFTGTPHRTNVTVSGLTFTTTNGTTTDDQRGYNLVSNPFVAPITISEFFKDNSSLNAIYYWDNEGLGKGAGRFVTRTSTGAISPSSGVTNSTNIAQTYLAPNQGFFIKVLSGGGSVNFNTSEIAYPTLNDNFLRAAVEPNYLRLNVDNDSANHDDCIIQFNTEASDSFDAALDVYKLLSPAYPVNIYTYKGVNKFAVQNRQPVSSNLTIPVGITTTKAQNYTFNLSNFNVLSPDINVYLQDNVANRNINLRDSSYKVSLKSDTIYNRFKLLFTNGSVSSIINPAKNYSSFQFWSQNGLVYANLGQTPQNITIHATDVTGRLISETHYNSALGNISVPGNYEKNRIYIFNISGSDFHQSTKILIQ